MVSYLLRPLLCSKAGGSLLHREVTQSTSGRQSPSSSSGERELRVPAELRSGCRSVGETAGTVLSALRKRSVRAGLRGALACSAPRVCPLRRGHLQRQHLGPLLLVLKSRCAGTLSSPSTPTPALEESLDQEHVRMWHFHQKSRSRGACLPGCSVGSR